MRVIEWDMGHRVVGHEGKCANLHGHRYRAEIHARALGLDAVGRVIDFSVLKSAIGGWIDDEWDHKTALYVEDPLLQVFQNAGQELSDFVVGKSLAVVSFNPTAENIASYLLNTVCARHLNGITVKAFKVTVWETPNCSATAEL